jgi:nucleoid DNA-binding protein
MWKIDMVRRIAEETGLTQATAADVVETILNEIKDA